MFGLPQDIFGEGPFGIADWGRLAIYEHLPVLHRNIDAQEGYPLRDYFKAFQGEAEDILGAISQLIEQRQPLLARDGANVPLITITSTSTGATTTVNTATDHGFTAGQIVVFAGAESCTPPIRGVQSVAQVLSTTQFTIDFTTTVGTTTGYVQAYDRSSVPVWVTNAVVANDPDYGMTTTFTFENGTDLDYLGVGYTAVLTIGVPPSNVDYTFKVARLRTRNADDSAATRNSALCYGQTLPPASVLSPPYLLKFVQPSALAYLTADFGLIYDENDPQVFRRSLVNNVAQYVMQKASQKGYQIRGNVSGFEVVAQGLYALCENADALPPSQVYLIDGAYYTDIPPRTFAFDDITADIEWVDPTTSTAIFALDEFVYTDTAGVLSPLAEVAQSITANYTGANPTLPVVTAVTAASAITLSTYGLPFGVEVTVQFPTAPSAPAPDPHNVFTVSTAGVFALVGPNGAATEEQYFIEAELSWNSGTRRAVYLISVPPSVTIALDDYRIGYFPKVTTSCCYCKSYKVRIFATVSARLYADLGGPPAPNTLVEEAFNRLLVKLKREQLPIHSEIAEATLIYP